MHHLKQLSFYPNADGDLFFPVSRCHRLVCSLLESVREESSEDGETLLIKQRQVWRKVIFIRSIDSDEKLFFGENTFASETGFQLFRAEKCSESQQEPKIKTLEAIVLRNH